MLRTNRSACGFQIRAPRWQLHRSYAGILQRVQEFICEEWVPIMDQVALARKQTVDRVGQIAGNLGHPQAVRRS